MTLCGATFLPLWKASSNTFRPFDEFTWMSHHLGITNTQQNTDFTNKNLSKIRMHVDENRGATLLPFDTPLATPLGVLTSSCECYITWESQTRNKTLILAINMHVKYAGIRFFVYDITWCHTSALWKASSNTFRHFEKFMWMLHHLGITSRLQNTDFGNKYARKIRMHTFFRFYYPCIAKSEGVLGEMGECGCWVLHCRC